MESSCENINIGMCYTSNIHRSIFLSNDDQYFANTGIDRDIFLLEIAEEYDDFDIVSILFEKEFQRSNTSVVVYQTIHFPPHETCMKK